MWRICTSFGGSSISDEDLSLLVRGHHSIYRTLHAEKINTTPAMFHSVIHHRPANQLNCIQTTDPNSKLPWLSILVTISWYPDVWHYSWQRKHLSVSQTKYDCRFHIFFIHVKMPNIEKKTSGRNKGTLLSCFHGSRLFLLAHQFPV